MNDDIDVAVQEGSGYARQGQSRKNARHDCYWSHFLVKEFEDGLGPRVGEHREQRASFKTTSILRN